MLRTSVRVREVPLGASGASGSSDSGVAGTSLVPKTTKPTQVKRFNRYDALVAEYHRLQQSKIDFLLNASNEMDRLRLFIKLLSCNDESNDVSHEKKKESAILIRQEIESFGKNVNNVNNVSNEESKHDDNGNKISFDSSLSKNDINFLQSEIARLRQSKIELIKSVNEEIDHLRSIIIDYSNKMDKINKINKINEMNEMKQSSNNSDSNNGNNGNNKFNGKYDFNDLWHDYRSLGKDNVVNIFLMGTKCSGKSTLMKQILLIYGNENDCKKLFKNSQNSVINSLVSCVYNVLNENNFLHSILNKNKMNQKSNDNKGINAINAISGMNDSKCQTSINYFKENHLSHYNAPYLTDTIGNHLKTLLNSKHEMNEMNEMNESKMDDNDSDNGIWGMSNNDDTNVNSIDENIRETLNELISQSTYYNTMTSLYDNIDKYSKRSWIDNISRNELLSIWDDNQLSNNKLIEYYDVVMKRPVKNIISKKTYRFWDISSKIFFNHLGNSGKKSKNSKNEMNENEMNLNAFFQFIKPKCFVYLTSGIFCYQFEKVFQKRYLKYEYYSSIEVSLQLFKTLFVPKIEIGKNNNNDNNNKNNINLNVNNNRDKNNNSNNNNGENDNYLMDMMMALESDEKETREERRKLSIMNLGKDANNVFDNLILPNDNSVDTGIDTGMDTIDESDMNEDMIDLIDDSHDIVEDCNFESMMNDELIQSWSNDRIPIITLFNKADILLKDMNNNNKNKKILLSFPTYDGQFTYDAIIDYLNTLFKSFDVDHRRPFHIYETCLLEDSKVQTIMHHIQSIVELQGTVVNLKS